MTQTSEQAREATFTFARKLRDRAFQKFLADNGYESGQDVIVALPDDLAADVFQRMFSQSASGPALIAIRRPADPHGYVFMMAGLGSRQDAENVTVGAGATVGMLYDTLSAKTGQYTIPRSWVRVRRLTHA